MQERKLVLVYRVQKQRQMFTITVIEILRSKTRHLF